MGLTERSVRRLDRRRFYGMWRKSNITGETRRFQRKTDLYAGPHCWCTAGNGHSSVWWTSGKKEEIRMIYVEPERERIPTSLRVRKILPKSRASAWRSPKEGEREREPVARLTLEKKNYLN